MVYEFIFSFESMVHGSWRTGRFLSLFSKCPTVLGSLANIGNHNVHKGFLALSIRAQIVLMIKIHCSSHLTGASQTFLEFIGHALRLNLFIARRRFHRLRSGRGYSSIMLWCRWCLVGDGCVSRIARALICRELLQMNGSHIHASHASSPLAHALHGLL